MNITYEENHTFIMTRRAKNFRLFQHNHVHLAKWTERERKAIKEERRNRWEMGNEEKGYKEKEQRQSEIGER